MKKLLNKTGGLKVNMTSHGQTENLSNRNGTKKGRAAGRNNTSK